MEWRTRLRWLFRRNRSEQDLDEEIRAHLDIESDENVEAGMSAEQARSASLRAFGNVTSTKESTREIWISGSLERLWQDLRFKTGMLFGITVLTNKVRLWLASLTQSNFIR